MRRWVSGVVGRWGYQDGPSPYLPNHPITLSPYLPNFSDSPSLAFLYTDNTHLRATL